MITDWIRRKLINNNKYSKYITDEEKRRQKRLKAKNRLHLTDKQKPARLQIRVRLHRIPIHPPGSLRTHSLTIVKNAGQPIPDIQIIQILVTNKHIKQFNNRYNKLYILLVNRK